MDPIITEFRLFPVDGDEPSDRTTQGTVVGSGGTLDFGAIDTTAEARDTPVRVVCWRVRDMGDACEVFNVRVYLEGVDASAGSTAWHMDISDTWTTGKTPVHVAAGTPGTVPDPSCTPNLTRIGGGTITGTAHDQTSQYIAISGTIGADVPAGTRTGIRLFVTYDFR